jgi:hypothetical protein
LVAALAIAGGDWLGPVSLEPHAAATATAATTPSARVILSQSLCIPRPLG